jgi:hypothetical protein
MFRRNLGGGAVAFETEGEADRVISVNPADLSQREWPSEVVENVRRYRERLVRSSAMSQSVNTPQASSVCDSD